LEENKCLVSILILTCNQEDTILQTLESVSEQVTSFNYEIIIGEDGSKDNTRKICEEFISSYSKKNIYLFSPFPNVGLIENFKRLLFAAKGLYVAFCGGDDYWTDNQKLQIQIKFLESNPDYGLVHTNYKIYYQNEDRFEELVFERSKGDIFRNLLSTNEIAAVTVMARKNLILEAIRNKIYDQGFLMEDYPMWLYISKKTKIGYIDKITAVWRKSDGSLSNSNNNLERFLFENSVLHIQSYFAEQSEYFNDLRDHLISKHREHLTIGYYNNWKKVARKSFVFLKKNNALQSFDTKIYYKTKYSGIINFFKRIKQSLSI
jgi:glycosyltransferase involved in cell wall biosynthesis